MGNRNSSNSKVHGQEAKVIASTNPRKGKQHIDAFRDENLGKPTPRTLKGHHGFGVYSDQQQSKTPLNSDDSFNDFIRRAKKNIRTVSHIGQEQSHLAPAPTPPEEASNSYKENQNDQFSNFIQRAKKKLRTTSSIRKNGSFKSVD